MSCLRLYALRGEVKVSLEKRLCSRFLKGLDSKDVQDRILGLFTSIRTIKRASLHSLQFEELAPIVKQYCHYKTSILTARFI